MIDKTAIIHPSAKIADDAIIGPYVVIGENVTIGARTRVISNAHIEFAEIGERCTISPFATIGSEPQDLGYKGEPTKVVIGDDTIIKEKTQRTLEKFGENPSQLPLPLQSGRRVR